MITCFILLHSIKKEQINLELKPFFLNFYEILPNYFVLNLLSNFMERKGNIDFFAWTKVVFLYICFCIVVFLYRLLIF